MTANVNSSDQVAHVFVCDIVFQPRVYKRCNVSGYIRILKVTFCLSFFHLLPRYDHGYYGYTQIYS